jgi:hypothetical protein
MEGLGATVDERGICSGTVLLMIGTALQEGDLACMSVPEVPLTRKKLKRCILDFALCSPGAADDDWFLEQKGLAARGFRALNFRGLPSFCKMETRATALH